VIGPAGFMASPKPPKLCQCGGTSWASKRYGFACTRCGGFMECGPCASPYSCAREGCSRERAAHSRSGGPS